MENIGSVQRKEVCDMAMPNMFKQPEHCVAKLPVGAKVREQKSGIVFLVAEHGHSGWPCTTLITDCVVKNASYDAAEPDSQNKYIRAFGNSDYPLSNIHQWLNSDAETWYHPSHFKDMPPENDYISRTPEYFYTSPCYPEVNKLRGPFDYVCEPGFLTWFSKDFVNGIVPVRLPVFTVKETGLLRREELYTGVFLPSLCEIGCEYQDAEGIGERFKLFEDPIYRFCAPTAEACGMPNGYDYRDVLWWYWTRNPNVEKPGMVFRITPGYRGGNFASRQATLGRCHVASGVRPMVNITGNFPVSAIPDAEGVYDLTPPPTGIPSKGHDMLAIPSDLTQTLTVNQGEDDPFAPGCVCTNLACVRNGMCQACSHYHSSGMGVVTLFEPTCKLDHQTAPFHLVERCFDELGRRVREFKEVFEEEQKKQHP